MKILWRLNALAARFSGNNLKIPVSNFGIVEPRNVYRSACPSLGALAKMKDDLGIKELVDLRILSESEFLRRKRQVESLGIHYTNIPMDEYNEIPQDTLKRVIGIVAWPGNHPILVHCKGGVHRTGLVILALRMWRMGYNWNEAFAEAKKFHFYSENGHDGVLRSMKRAGGQPLN